MKDEEELRQRVEQQSQRMQKAQREHPTLMSQTVYAGTLGLLLVLPIVGGAYLGHWLDSLQQGYSSRWTISLILTGVVLGAVNVYLFINKE
ncbi:AtpZ/AtpI family protein [Pseudomaricurvus sp. HS19]|uniref:AtpZ/AtpI family protein n=1 Tax=Pseudomaricurvus sp. HS19 TaxID=2692626 RepID=UPI00136C3E85|nr:AtpZ/AtpI family protein [Pseudomaricurvus sp. HS19]MYM62157.1 F0F1 ATP synthase subunit [Pseudomaricurvus sp. HS19]